MADWREFETVLLGRWPSQVSAWGRVGLAAFASEVEADGVSPDEGIRALRAHASDFPPSASTVSRLAERAAQGPVPSFAEAQAIIARYIGTTLGYHNPTVGFDLLVRKCAAHHEAIGRLVLALGPRGCKELPDPRHAHGARVGAAERLMAEAAKDWEADPRRGVAVAEALRVVGAGSAGVLGEARRELAEGGSA